MAQCDYIFQLGNRFVSPNGTVYYEAAEDGNGDYLFLEIDDFTSPSGSISMDNKYLLMAGKKVSMEDIKYQADMYGYIPYGYYSFPLNSIGNNSIDYWAGEIVPNAMGGVDINFNEPAAFVPTSSFTFKSISQTIHREPYYIIDHMSIHTFTPDGTFDSVEKPYQYHTKTSLWSGTYITDYLPAKYAATGTAVSHPVKVNFGANGKLSIINLTGDGYMQSKDATYRFVPKAIEGEYDFNTGKVKLYAGQHAFMECSNKGSYNVRTNGISYTLMNTDASSVDGQVKLDYKDIEGTISQDNTIAHRVLHNYWVDFGGTLRTYRSVGSITLPSFAYIYYREPVGNSNETMYSTQAYTGGTITLNQVDVTLEAKLNASLSKNDELFVPSGELQVLANDDLVDHYEIYALPGSYTHGEVITNKDFDHENGHTNATLISTIAPSKLKPVVEGQEYPKAASYYKYLKCTDVEGATTNNKFSFFVKAVYKKGMQAAPAKAASKASAELLPTFHAMVTPPVSTGIDGVYSDVPVVDVKVQSGAIVITGAGDEAVEVNVFTPAGQNIYSGRSNRVEVPRGMYIVKAGTVTTKVVVR